MILLMMTWVNGDLLFQRGIIGDGILIILRYLNINGNYIIFQHVTNNNNYNITNLNDAT